MHEPDQDAPRRFRSPAMTLRAVRRIALLVAGPVVAIAVAAWMYLSGGRYETTDDAYVRSSKVAISADISGRVHEVMVHENQKVRRGDVLFSLDDAPFRIAVDEAGARLAAARMRVQTLKANYRQRQSDLDSARATLQFARGEHERQQRLVLSGIASRAQVEQAAHAFDEAQARVAGTKQQIGAVLASLAGDPDIPVERHPDVQQEQAALDRAKLNLSYTIVKAPADGIVTRVDELQAGTAINAAAPLFALVSDKAVWIEANFKEDQLAHMRPGQTATVHVDTYGDRTFTGKVASVSPGTGSQFSVLPPENATGNWVKVVQRLPVRIELDNPEQGIALRSGLSADVSVDTLHKRKLPWVAGDPPSVRAAAQQ